MQRIEEKGFKVVTDPSQVEMWTMDGWRLVAILDNEAAMPCLDQEPADPSPVFVQNPNNLGYTQAPPQYNTNTYPMMVSVTRHHPHRFPSFLLVQEESTVTANLISSRGAEREAEGRRRAERETQVSRI